MSSAICFNVDQSKVLSFGDGLFYLFCLVGPETDTKVGGTERREC